MFSDNFHPLVFVALRLMGSQHWWFGDPRTLLYRVKPLFRRVQSFIEVVYFWEICHWDVNPQLDSGK